MPDLFEDLLGEVTTPKTDPTPPETTSTEPETPEEEDPENVTEDENLQETQEEETTDPEPTVNPVDQVLTPKTEKAESKDDKAARAFAEMRAKNAQYEKALKRAAEVNGMSVEQFLEKLEETALQKKAKDTNTDPEIIRRLEAIEAERAELQTTKVRFHLESQFNKLKADLKLNEQDLVDFTAQLYAEGFNFNDLSVDYVTLYRGKNYNKLIEKERQQWIARADKGNSAGTVMSKNGKTSGKDKPIETMNDLDDLLSGMNNPN